MRKYLYTTLFLTLLAQGGVMAQDNNTSKGGFFGKLKDTFSTEIKIGNYTFKDGSVYTGEMKGRKPNGKGKTVFKNSNIPTETSMTVTGQMISSMEKVLIFSIREIATKVLIFWENVPEKAFTIMPMEINM